MGTLLRPIVNVWGVAQTPCGVPAPGKPAAKHEGRTCRCVRRFGHDGRHRARCGLMWSLCMVFTRTGAAKHA